MVSVFTEVFLILNYHGDGSCPEPQARSLCPSPDSKLLQEMPVCWENPMKESNTSGVFNQVYWETAHVSQHMHFWKIAALTL